jgi:hypothetical protein
MVFNQRVMRALILFAMFVALFLYSNLNTASLDTANLNTANPKISCAIIIGLAILAYYVSLFYDIGSGSGSKR